METDIQPVAAKKPKLQAEVKQTFKEAAERYAIESGAGSLSNLVRNLVKKILVEGGYWRAGEREY